MLDEPVAPLVGILDDRPQRRIESLALVLLHLLLELRHAAFSSLERGRGGECAAERHGPAARLGQQSGRVSGEDVEERLERVVEHDLVVLP